MYSSSVFVQTLCNHFLTKRFHIHFSYETNQSTNKKLSNDILIKKIKTSSDTTQRT